MASSSSSSSSSIVLTANSSSNSVNVSNGIPHQFHHRFGDQNSFHSNDRHQNGRNHRDYGHHQNGDRVPCKERMASYKKALYSDDIGKQLYAVSQLRVLLSDEEQPPIDLVIKSNCVPRLIEMLRCRDSINLLVRYISVISMQFLYFENEVGFC